MAKKTIAVMVASIIVGGCKVDFQSEINVSDLQKPMHKAMGQVAIETPGCDSDKNKELIDQLSGILASSEYIECKRVGMASYNYFDIPIALGEVSYDKEGKVDIPQDVGILKDGQKNILFFVSKDLREKTRSLSKNNHTPEIKYSENIRIKNDTDTDWKLKVYATFIGADPYTIGDYTLEKGKSRNFKPSDAASALVMKEGQALFLSER